MPEQVLKWTLRMGAASALNPLERAAVYLALYKVQLLLIGGIGMTVGYLCRQPGDFERGKSGAPAVQGRNLRVSQHHRHSQPVVHRVSPVSRSVRADTGVLAGQSYRFADKLVIGRDPKRCNVVFPAGTRGVSGVHCTLRLQNGCVTVTDENATYGTYVDGKRVQPGQTVVMHRGQRLSLGSGKQTLTLHS